MSSAQLANAMYDEQCIEQISNFSAPVFLIGLRARPGNEDWKVRRAIVRARSAFVNMRLDDASKATAQLGTLLSTVDRSQIVPYACALRILEASILAAKGDFSSSRGHLISVTSQGENFAAATILRYVNWKLGESQQNCPPDQVDYLSTAVGGKSALRIFDLCVSAMLAFDRVHLTLSADLATEALRLARERYGNHSPMSTFPAILLAQVAYEQGRFEEADSLLRPRLAVIRACGWLECVARASELLMRLTFHRGRQRAALGHLRETESLCRSRRAASAGPHPQLPQAPSPDDNLTFSAVEMALRRACSPAFQNHIEDQIQFLIPWLRLGAARGLRMAFADAGRPLLTLLEHIYHHVSRSDPRISDLRPYISTLLRSTIQATVEVRTVIYRPLSSRETGILEMIAHGMSNKRIAQALGITPETVKSHAKNIFVKLESRTRAQAVARAEAIGFL